MHNSQLLQMKGISPRMVVIDSIENNRKEPDKSQDVAQQPCCHKGGYEFSEFPDDEMAEEDEDLHFSEYTVDPEEVEFFPSEELADEFDKYADLEELPTYSMTPGFLRFDKVTPEETESIGDFLTPDVRQDLNRYTNPYEEIKAAGNSGETSDGKFDDADDTYLFFEQLGGSWIDHDFDKAPCRVPNPCGFTMYWEMGDRSKWNEAWPQLYQEMEQFGKRLPEKLVVELRIPEIHR